MSLEEKVGQLLMIGLPGPDLDDATRELVAHCRPGGVILFDSNIVDPGQLARFIRDVRSAVAAVSPGGGEALVSIDQEGGVVARLTERHGVVVFPGNMALAAAEAGMDGPAPQETLAYRVGRAMGRQLRALGINMDLAPVLDVNNNPDNPVIGVRSFGEDPQVVARLGAATIAGLRDAGVAAVGKHFPGHGDTALDSHFTLPAIPHRRERLEQVELVPFRAAVAAGVEAIMTAHVTFPAIDPRPGISATLSPAALTGLLRRDLGFPGVIMTDAIEMKSVSEFHGPAEAAVLALEAGADIILVGQDPTAARAAFDGLLAAVRTGRVDGRRLDESVRRLLALKAWLARRSVEPTGRSPAAPEDRPEDLALEVARRAITLLRDTAGLLPLRLGPEQRLALVVPGPDTMVGRTAGRDLAALVAFRHRHLVTVAYSGTAPVASPSAEPQADVERAVRDSDVALLVTAEPRLSAETADLAAAVVGTGRPVVWASLWSPYDHRAVPAATTCVAAYSFRPVSLRALVEAVFGEVPMTGRGPG